VGHNITCRSGLLHVPGALQVLPERTAVRTPSALLGGAINVAPVFAVALALFRNRWTALASAAMLALSPANVIISRRRRFRCQPPSFSRLGCWQPTSTSRSRLAPQPGAILGYGIYAYITSILFMPFLSRAVPVRAGAPVV
jgi:hypothetical protein